jgi:hypothetical protein
MLTVINYRSSDHDKFVFAIGLKILRLNSRSGRKIVEDGKTERGLTKGPDAHGQAALLLSESILHGLVERSVIRMSDAIEIVEIAADVKTEMAFQEEEASSTIRKSLALLASIKLSLETEGTTRARS